MLHLVVQGGNLPRNRRKSVGAGLTAAVRAIPVPQYPYPLTPTRTLLGEKPDRHSLSKLDVLHHGDHSALTF